MIKSMLGIGACLSMIYLILDLSIQALIPFGVITFLYLFACAVEK